MDGGPAEVIRGLIPALHLAGVKADVFATSKGFSSLDGDLTEAPWLRLFRHAGPKSLTFSPSMARALRDNVQNYDLVHIHGLQSHVGSAAMRAARALRRPYVIEPHGALDSYHWREHHIRKSTYLRLFDRSNWRHSGGWLVSSSFEKDQASAVVATDRFFELPLGVDQDLLSIADVREPSLPTTVLYLGRITKKKRLDLLLEAMAKQRVRESRLRLVVAGAPDGTLGLDPEKFVQENGLSSSITITGPADRSTREKLMSDADIFVLPSEDESFGVAVAEAMAAGLAVVSSDRVGAAIAAKDGVARVRLDAEAIADQLLRLASEPEETNAMARRGHDYARQNFTWSHAAQCAIAAYEKALSNAQA